MQQPIQDGSGNDLVSEDRSPVAIALVAGENDAAAFIRGADQLKEDGGSEFIQGQVTHFVNDWALDTHACAGHSQSSLNRERIRSPLSSAARPMAAVSPLPKFHPLMKWGVSPLYRGRQPEQRWV
jgi:hypothetical protein